jgi:hypothetical protein
LFDADDVVDGGVALLTDDLVVSATAADVLALDFSGVVGAESDVGSSRDTEPVVRRGAERRGDE